MFYCLYIIAKYTNDLTIFALNTFEKYVKEKWDKLEDHEKKVITSYLFDNINLRLDCLNSNLIDNKRQYLLASINKLNYIIVLIASKDWPKLWPKLIDKLCNIAKNNISFESENCMRILLLLGKVINKNYEEIMTTHKNLELTYQMSEELDKILGVVKFFIVEKSYELINVNDNNNNNTNNQLAINILKQSIKLFDEFISWFIVENIFDKSIMWNLLSILNSQICKNEIIECFGSLFKFKINKLKEQNRDELRKNIFEIYNSFICIFHNTIVKNKNFTAQYEKIIKNEQEKISGFENFTVISEKCLINFFIENFEFIKEKSIYSLDFLCKYNDTLKIGLHYILQFTNFKNDQIKNNAMEFWYFIISDIFTLILKK